MEARATADFRSLVEAVRAGTVFAHDNKAFQRWQRQTQRPAKSLGDAELERAIMNIGQMFPANVVHGTV